MWKLYILVTQPTSWDVYIGEDSATRPDTEFHINNFLFLIDPFHMVNSLSNRSSIEKSIKPFLKMKGQIAN